MEFFFIIFLSFYSLLFFVFVFFLNEYFFFQNDYFEKKIIDSIFASEVTIEQKKSTKIVTFGSKLPFQEKQILYWNYFLHFFDQKSQKEIHFFIKKWRNHENNFYYKKITLNLKILDFEQKWYLSFIKRKSDHHKLVFVASNLQRSLLKK